MQLDIIGFLIALGKYWWELDKTPHRLPLRAFCAIEPDVLNAKGREQLSVDNYFYQDQASCLQPQSGTVKFRIVSSLVNQGSCPQWIFISRYDSQNRQEKH